MKNSIVLALFASLVLILSGCGSNDYADGNGSNNAAGNVDGNITTTLQSIKIDKNSGNIIANLTLLSTYDASITATLNRLDMLLGGCSFEAGSVSVAPDFVVLDSNSSSKEVIVVGTLSDPLCAPTS